MVYKGLGCIEAGLVPHIDYIYCKAISKGNMLMKSKKISNDQELIQSDLISCPQNQKGNN